MRDPIENEASPNPFPSTKETNAKRDPPAAGNQGADIQGADIRGGGNQAPSKQGLSEVVPWGRSLDEYQRMFLLNAADLTSPILGCADGPASFNAEVAKMGGRVVSFDPIYRFTADMIAGRIDASREQVLAYARSQPEEFLWTAEIPDPDALCGHRMATMQLFLQDFAAAEPGRYVTGQLPDLPFANGEFNLALCSHFLFLYSEHLDLEFHINTIESMLRVASEVRIFPLLELGGQVSRHLQPSIEALQAKSCLATVENTNYEFQRGANQMLRVRAS